MLTPHKIAKSGSESAHQKALFAFVAVARVEGFSIAKMWASTGNIFKTLLNAPVPELEWLHAIPNGGLRDKRTAANLKAEGVKSGVADMFLPFATKGMHGLYIELKKPSLKPKKKTAKGGMSDEQIAFREYCVNNKYGFVTCYGWEEAANVLEMYIGVKLMLERNELKEELEIVNRRLRT